MTDSASRDVDDLLYLVSSLGRNIEVCPACGSVFFEHRCHADQARLR